VYQITLYLSKSVLTDRRSDVCEIQFKIHIIMIVACEQALLGTLVVGREKEGKLATTSLEFEYLHRKSRCEMVIGGDDISNEHIILNWHVFFNGCLHSCSFPLCADWWKSDSSVSGEPRENWRWNSSCKLSFLFLPHCQSTLDCLLSGFCYHV